MDLPFADLFSSTYSSLLLILSKTIVFYLKMYIYKTIKSTYYLTSIIYTGIYQ